MLLGVGTKFSGRAMPQHMVLPNGISVVAGRSSEQIEEAHRADPIIGFPSEGTAQRRPGWLGINE